MRRKRLVAAPAGEIAKAVVLQRFLRISGIWFTVPFGGTITIGRERIAGTAMHNTPRLEAVADQFRR